MAHEKKHIDESMSSRIKWLSIEMLIVVAVFFSCCILVIAVIRYVFLEQKDAFDQRVFAYLHTHISNHTTSIMEFFTFFGSHFFLVPANLLIIAWTGFIKKDKWIAIKTAAVSITSLVLMFSLKFIFHRQRPISPLLREVPGLSFPSGHAFMSFTFFGIMIYLVHKKVQHTVLKYFLILLFIAVIAMVCISRIYLRVHYATDVLAGLSLGMIWLFISLLVLHFMEARRKPSPQSI